jgi:predicted nucleotidyltransferase
MRASSRNCASAGPVTARSPDVSRLRIARGEKTAHDVDLAVRLGQNFSEPGLQYFSRLSDLEGRLSRILGCKVDVIEEPVRKKRFQTEIDRDRTLAF